MKTRLFYSLILSLAISVNAFGIESAVTHQIVLDGTKFTYPLLEKWIVEYSKINPAVKIKIASKANNLIPDINIIAHQPDQTEMNQNQEIIYTGEYALIPVTNDFNPQLPVFAKKGLSKKEIDKLFFETVDYDSDEPAQKSKYPAVIYARDNKACTSNALAKYFGRSASEIRGKKVFGDDIYLISAIKKDSLALTYNTLSYVFDTNSRQLKSGLALLPIDVKKENKQFFSNNLDDIINLLESGTVESVPVEKIGFIINKNKASKEITDFIQWILNDGQNFNHGIGFLKLDKNLLSEEIIKLSDKLLTQK